MRTLVGQRVFGLAMGYEDLNDHERLLHDPVIVALLGNLKSKRADCVAVACKSTLNRLELFTKRGSDTDRYHKTRPGRDRGPVDRSVPGGAPRGTGSDHPGSGRHRRPAARQAGGPAFSKANPRFIVTSLEKERWPAKALYEDTYCARCKCENRIKEAQLDLFADRLSTETFRADQLRLSKIGAVVTLSVRRVRLAMSWCCPNQAEFHASFHALTAAARQGAPHEPASLSSRSPIRARAAPGITVGENRCPTGVPAETSMRRPR